MSAIENAKIEKKIFKRNAKLNIFFHMAASQTEKINKFLHILF